MRVNVLGTIRHMIMDTIQLHSEMAKLYSASPREITSPFPVQLYPNYTQKHVITYTNHRRYILSRMILS